MERREFIKDTCGSCAAVAIGLLIGSNLMESCKVSATISVFKTTQTDGKAIIPLSVFDQQNFKLLRVNNYGYDIGVQKQQDGSFLALLLMCTHAGQALTKSGTGYYCTLHGSKFSSDGKVTKGPASSSLESLAIQIEKGQIIITLDPAYS